MPRPVARISGRAQVRVNRNPQNPCRVQCITNRRIVGTECVSEGPMIGQRLPQLFGPVGQCCCPGLADLVSPTPAQPARQVPRRGSCPLPVVVGDVVAKLGLRVDVIARCNAKHDRLAHQGQGHSSSTADCNVIMEAIVSVWNIGPMKPASRKGSSGWSFAEGTGTGCTLKGW